MTTCAATVLIPTHAHAPLLPFAIRSVLAQTLADFELFVVGDGADAATREAVAWLANLDRRIRYFDFPKGERHGELSRHRALEEATGRIVAYLCDDDLWLEDHLANLAAALETADFVHTVHTFVRGDGEVDIIIADLSDPAYRRLLVDTRSNFFGPTFAAHTMAAYRSLSVGWSPAPPEVWTDLHMWRKLLVADGLRFRSLPIVDAVHFPSPQRREWTAEMRHAELAAFTAGLAEPGGVARYRARATAVLVRRLLDAERKNVEAKHAELTGGAKPPQPGR